MKPPGLPLWHGIRSHCCPRTYSSISRHISLEWNVIMYFAVCLGELWLGGLCRYILPVYIVQQITTTLMFIYTQETLILTCDQVFSGYTLFRSISKLNNRIINYTHKHTHVPLKHNNPIPRTIFGIYKILPTIGKTKIFMKYWHWTILNGTSII